jgi:hypothetical protein
MTAPMIEWPELDYAAWSDTAATLHRWLQMAGKVRLAHEPWLNHSWQVPLYLSANGLTTSIIHDERGAFDIEFDSGFPLEPMTVAAFHARFIAALKAIEVDPHFDGMPSEIPDAVAFADDTIHHQYDAGAVERYWRALLRVDRIFKRFRTGFIGKASPVHLFWGSFDLAVTRFSGRAAPLHPGGVPGLPDAVAREAYDHEVSSAGFWPGDASYPHAAFYSYAYPPPEGFGEARVKPDAASFSTELGEWVLPYDVVRTASDPGAMLMDFLGSTYQAAARLADWDATLECALGEPARPRRVGPEQI